MSYDPSESARREMLEAGQPRHDLELDAGSRWTTEELTRDFDVLGFAAPFVMVRRRADGVRGTLEFTHSPRIYFGWTEA